MNFRKAGILLIQLSIYLAIQPSGVQAALYSYIPDVPERISGSKKLVVATVEKIESRWDSHPHGGGRIIVSRITLRVEETLKGPHQDTVQIDVEGGTVDGMTMGVSDLPQIKLGDREVFFLTDAVHNVHKPHLRGLGIFKLDSNDTVENTTLRLNDIRNMAGKK